MVKAILAGFFTIATALPACAQITAQGQGGNDVLWMAFGIEQKLGKRWTNKNAIAYSRHSGEDDLTLLEQSGVFTVREEIVYRISRHFKLSQGVFYAGRNYYDAEHPSYINEIRLYPRLYHEFNAGRIRFSHYIRADLRFFSGPGFRQYSKPFELRNRYNMKVSVPLDKNEEHFITGITEFFFATDTKLRPEGAMQTPYDFTENRTSFFYRRRLKDPDMYFDAGVMFQTWKDSATGNFRETVLLQVDIILIDPFHRK